MGGRDRPQDRASAGDVLIPAAVSHSRNGRNATGPASRGAGMSRDINHAA
jgi:hypothetical protein